MHKAYRNISVLFILIFAFVILGFFRTYFGHLGQFNTFPVILNIHAIAFITWILLLIFQPLTIIYDKRNIHRILGKFSYFLVPVILFTIWEMIKISYARDNGTVPFPQIAEHLILPITDALVFATLYVLAIINKRNSAYHMRYIIACSLVLISPSGARFLGYTLGAIGPLIGLIMIHAIMIGLILYDKIKLNKVYPPYLIAWTLLIASHLIEIFFSKTLLWQSMFLKITHLF